MESLYGKQTFPLDAAAFAARLQRYREVAIDIGTGDGRYVQHIAQCYPQRFVIGIDACRENLSQISRQSLPNAWYLIANAEALPAELLGLATYITVNFPWGSLLTGLLNGNSRVMDNLQMIAQSGAWLEITLNSSALLQQGWSLGQGDARVKRALQGSGFEVKSAVQLDAKALRTYPTTWAKRLAYGGDPHALCLRAVSPGRDEVQVGVRVLFHSRVAGEQGRREMAEKEAQEVTSSYTSEKSLLENKE